MQRSGSRITADELGSRLGRKIAVHRKSRGMTQAHLAERVGVDSETISRFERGTTLPSLLRLFEIAQVLEVGISELLLETSLLAQDKERALTRHIEGLNARDQKLLLTIATLMKETDLHEARELRDIRDIRQDHA